MKIYTKRGDQGMTDLFGGARVSKANQRVRAYGTVDAANTAIGFVVACESIDADLKNHLLEIMSDLFDLGAEFATAQKEAAQKKLSGHLQSRVDEDRILELESYIDQTEADLTPLKNFILPTGTEACSRLHLARVAIRCAEQEVVALKDEGEFVRPEALHYLNRLSDLLFVWARWCNQRGGQPDIPWRAKKALLS